MNDSAAFSLAASGPAWSRTGAESSRD